MKKIFFFQLLAAAAFMTSCSSSDDVVADNGNENNIASEEMMPIQLGISGTNSVSVRGTGTVGSEAAAAGADVWAGQKIQVSMFKKGTWEVPTLADGLTIENTVYKTNFGENPGTGIFNGAAANAGSGEARPIDDKIRYYPINNQYDFVGYRLDDAVTTAAPAAVNDTLKVEFTLNGTQDIMGATVAPALASGDTLTANIDAALASIAPTASRARLFSATTARRGVHPSLAFKHLTTRLHFTVIPTTDEAADASKGIRVKSIKVASFTKGTLNIASHTDGFVPSIDWQRPTKDTLVSGNSYTVGKRDTLTLMSRQDVAGADTLNLEAFHLVDMRGADAVHGTGAANKIVKNDEIPAGEAILVAPDSIYAIVVTLEQELPKQYSNPATVGDVQYIVSTFVQLITAPSPMHDFEAGKSYNVKISVGGLMDVKVFASLEKWVTGDDVELNPEDDEPYNEFQ